MKRSDITRMAIAITASALLLGACAGGSTPTRTVDLTTATYNTAEDLATASDFLVRGTVVAGSSSAVPLNSDAGLVYMANSVAVEMVVAQRPGGSSTVAAGDTIRVGVSTLDPAQESAIANFGELSEKFPTAENALPESTEVIMFLVANARETIDFEVVGFAQINGGTLRWDGFPGPLAGTTTSLDETQSAVLDSFAIPRVTTDAQTSSPDIDPVTDVGRSPAIEPGE